MQFLRFIVQNIEAYLSNAVNEITLLILKLQELMCVKLLILLSKKASSNLQLKKNEFVSLFKEELQPRDPAIPSSLSDMHRL